MINKNTNIMVNIEINVVGWFKIFSIVNGDVSVKSIELIVGKKSSLDSCIVYINCIFALALAQCMCMITEC